MLCRFPWSDWVSFLAVMWLSQKGNTRLDVEGEVAFRDANTELNAAKQGDW